MAERGVACVFAEPQFNAGLVSTLAEGTDMNVAMLDPLGADIPPGPGAYPELLRGLATAVAACLDPTG